MVDANKKIDFLLHFHGKIDFILHSIGMSLNVRKKRSYTNLNYDWIDISENGTFLEFPQNDKSADPLAINYQWHARNYEDIVQAINNDRNPRIDGKEARRAVALICAIYKSAGLGGQKVEVF